MPQDSEYILGMKDKMRGNYAKRTTLTNPKLRLCTVLDPLTRHYIKKSDHLSILLPYANTEADRQNPPRLTDSIPPASNSMTQPDPAPPAKRRRLDPDVDAFDFDSWLASQNDHPEDDDPVESLTHTAARKEVDRYLLTPAPKGIDVMDWWRSQKLNFPILYQVARTYLSIQSTSVPSERAWSTAGHYSSGNRCALSEDHLEMLIYLNRNHISRRNVIK